KLFVFNVKTGDQLWEKDFKKEYRARVEGGDGSGQAAHPIVEGNLVISFVGGDENANVVAFDKMTGKEGWRSLGTNGGTQARAAGKRQLLVWHCQALAAIDPVTGVLLWEAPFKVYGNVNPGIPVKDGDYLMVSSFNLGSMMLKLDPRKPGATMVWRAREGVSDT